MNGDVRESPRELEYRLLAIDRSGSGKVHVFELDETCAEFKHEKATTFTWQQTTDLVNFAVSVLDNKLYISGGFSNNIRKTTKSVLRYDPEDDSWRDLSRMLRSRCMHASVGYQGKVYALGGYDKDGRTIGGCEVYDPVLNQWEKSANLVQPRSNHACVQMGDDIYVSGGSFENTGNDNLWVFERDKWRELDPECPHRLSRGMERHAMAEVEGVLYFIGGLGEDANSAKVSTTSSCIEAIKLKVPFSNLAPEDVISPWQRDLPGMTTARYNAGTAVLGKKIYVIGGTNLETKEAVKQVECFDTGINTWHDAFQMKQGGISNVTCVILKCPPEPEEPPIDPYAQVKKMAERWVMW